MNDEWESDLPRTRFGLWFALILVLHLALFGWIFGWWRPPSAAPPAAPAEAAAAPAAAESLPPEEARRFMRLLETQSLRLPALQVPPDQQRAPAEIVLPDADDLARSRQADADQAAREAARQAEIDRLRQQRERLEQERQRQLADQRRREEQERQQAAALAARRAAAAAELERSAAAARKAEADEAAKAKAATAAREKAAAEAKAATAAKARAEADAKARAAAEAARVARAKPVAPATPVAPARPVGDGDDGARAGQAKADLDWFDRNVLYPALHERWIQPRGPEFRGRNLRVTVRVAVSRDGRLVEKTITAPSGSADVDASVQRALDALQRTSPLPDSFDGQRHSQIFTFVLE
jgi:colicin import membrane protein